MTITALLVAAIGLSVIAIMSSNNSNVSDDIDLNYMKLAEKEVSSVNLISNKSRTRFEIITDEIGDYQVNAVYERNCENHYTLFMRDRNTEITAICID